MAVEFHEFDRDGDLLLLLTSRSESNDDAKSSSSTDAGTPEDIDMNPTLDGITILGGVDGNALGPVDIDPTPDQLMDNTDSSGVKHSMTHEDPPTKVVSPKKVHMLVSSKTLMLASPVFKAMLQNDTFQEGRELQSTGKVCLTAN